MTGYMLIWILLQEIEKLEEELNTYKQNSNKNWFSVQSSFLPALFFNKKRYVFLHTYQVSLTMTGYLSFKLILV